MSRLLRGLPILLVVLCPLHAGAEEGALPPYPETRTVDAFDEMHGERVADPYRWLEPDEDAEVEKWDHAQMDYARKRLATYPGRERIRKRLEKEFAGGSMRSMPTIRGGRMWFTRRPPGANHGVVYVTDLSGKAEPRVVLDPNTWSEDGTAGLSSWVVSPDGSRVAYRRDEKGSEDTTLFVRDVITGEDLPDVITRTKFSPIVWTKDGKGFYYSRMPAPDDVPEGEEQYHRRIYYHELGTLPVDDPIVYGDGRPMLESKWIYTSSDEQHLFINRGMPYKNTDTFELTRTGPRTWALEPIVVGDESRTWVDRVGDTYILNTDKWRGERQIYTMKRKPDGTLGPWEHSHFVQHPEVIQDTYVIGGQVLCHMKKDVVSRILVQPLAGGAVRELELPSPGTVSDIATTAGSTKFWLRFESYSLPPTTYSCDIRDPNLRLKMEEQLETTVDLDQLVSERFMYPSKDGTKIPLFVLRRKDVPLNGKAPTVVYGYGGFRVGLYPRFSRTRAVWAETGGVLAVACLRGGDEYGEAWHEAGCLGNKQNVYDDFIAAADWLVKTGKAARDKLAIQGGSNGGLLTAVVVNQRPDLCRAGISSVPLTDMLRFHRFQFAKTWTKEYGDPDVAEEFAWIRPYSPYHNAKKGARYPAMLLKAGLADGRVNAFHARKMAAVWQAYNASPHPILLRVDRESGHGAASMKQYIDEVVDTWSFLLMELGEGPAR